MTQHAKNDFRTVEGITYDWHDYSKVLRKNGCDLRSMVLRTLKKNNCEICGKRIVFDGIPKAKFALHHSNYLPSTTIFDLQLLCMDCHKKIHVGKINSNEITKRFEEIFGDDDNLRRNKNDN